MFEQHGAGDEEEPGGGDHWGNGDEGGEAKHRQQEEGAGEGDGHHVAEVFPAFAGCAAADDGALEEDLAGADGVFAIGVAEGYQANQQVGVGSEDGARDEDGEEKPGDAVIEPEAGLDTGGAAFGCGDDDFPVIGNEGVELAHGPGEGAAAEEGFENGEGAGDHLEEAFDSVGYGAGVFVDEGY